MIDDLREKVAELIDRLKLTSAWAFSMNGVPDDPEADTPMATIEDAIAALSIIFDPDAALSAMPTWRPVPAEVQEGVEPWDGRPVLIWVPTLYRCGDDFPRGSLRTVPAVWGGTAWGARQHWVTCLSRAVGDYSGGCTEDSVTIAASDVSHWMPIPAPPSGAEGEG